MTTILVIEDNPDNLELMTYLLKAFGHSTLSAIDGEHGIAMACRELPDLILCDVNLPGVDGYTVAKELKKFPALRDTPLVAVTALAMVGDREKGLAAGFDGYIPKPIDPEKFVAEIDGFLRAELRGKARRRDSVQPNRIVETPRATKATVLVVDDSPTNCELIDQTLTPFGYRVRIAHSVQVGLELAAASVPDLILSDLHMPGEDGFNLIRRIKSDPLLESVPFIFISSSVWGERDRQTALQLGISRFLLRPIEPQALIDEIVACLAAHAGVAHGDNPSSR